MTAERKWGVGSNQYIKRPGSVGSDGRRTAPSTPLTPQRVQSEQEEMTHISWDISQVDLSLIQFSSVERARHRFRASFPDLIWNAAALEGNTFTLPEVRTLLDGATVGGHRVEEEKQILALSEGYSLVDELVGAGEFRLDKVTSDRIHGLVAEHEAIESGHFRGEGSVSGGGSVRLANGGYMDGTPIEELPGRWNDLTECVNGLDDPRERALAFSASATRTQFYFDGNKRTSRLMMTGILLSNGFDTVNIPNSRRLEFNQALDALFTDDDATELMSFTASCALTLDAGFR